ncbi:uncharacterized protein [Haliotis asinina]|uniref:uncharacterized protein n=1 Tax=Haliotis asinina TaxID=109174 RepID=UPI0035318586
MARLTSLCITFVAASTFATLCQDSQHCSDCNSTTGYCITDCDRGYYDQKCLSVCSENCRNDTCELSSYGSDKCTEGCDLGYQGTSCNIPCDSPGGNCTVCPGGCDGGYCQLGSSCVSGCVDFSYGTDCNTCSSRCKSCNWMTGQCTECQQSYGGPHCEIWCKHCIGESCQFGCFQRCVDGFYGKYCNKTCLDAVVDINGMKNITVSVNDTVTFQCVVQGCPPPDVSLVHTGYPTPAMDMFRRNSGYERVIRVHNCSQLGRYSCQVKNFTDASDKLLHAVEMLAIPWKRDVKDCEIEAREDGKAPSGKIKFTLCAYPEPVIKKVRFERNGSPKDITDNKNYNLTMETLMSNMFEYTFTITNIGDEDFGVYIFTVASGGRESDILIVASQPKEIAGITFFSISIIVGGLLVGVSLIFVAVACLAQRRKTISGEKDYEYTALPDTHTGTTWLTTEC